MAYSALSHQQAHSLADAILSFFNDNVSPTDVFDKTVLFGFLRQEHTPSEVFEWEGIRAEIENSPDGIAPEDLFEEAVLVEWAERNGFVKKEE